MKSIIIHYGSYMTSLSMRKLYDEQGNTYWDIDEDTRDRLRSKPYTRHFSFQGLITWLNFPFCIYIVL